ncbi:MAG: ATP-binding protein [Lysobacteraceae bacterium]
MSFARLVTLLGCAVAIITGLATLGLPAHAMQLALIGTAAAGIALAATLISARPVRGEHAATPAGGSTSDGGGNATGDDGNLELIAELERLRALEQELTLAKQEAEAATMAKGEFLATMSHEIRTPLNGVIPLLDLLQSTPLSPDQRDYLGTAFASAQQLLRIVDDILDYSKLDANKLQLENVGINLRELSSGVLRLMEKSAEAKGLRLGLAIDSRVRPVMRGDPVRLRQVLTNLVSNAIKFTERGSVSVHISRLGETRTRNQLRFEVRDTGIGISTEAAEQLFQAFSQADASTTRTFGGTGLGLAICKRIITLMGGRIGVDSTPGKGSTFWFEVALDKALGDIEGRSALEAGTVQVLLVTANAAQQKRFSQSLQQWGMGFVHAANTQEALARLRAPLRPGQRGFDMVLVDAASIPTTLLALHRVLLRETDPQHTVRVYLRANESLPPELGSTAGVHVLTRDSTDVELHARLTALLESPPEALPDPTPARTGSATTAPTAQVVPISAAVVDHTTPTPATPTLAATSAAVDSTAAPSVPTPAPASVIPAAPAAPAATTPSPAQAEAATPAPTSAGDSVSTLPDQIAAPVQRSVTPVRSPSAGAAPGRVLLVEDNPVNRQVAQRLLSLAGIAFDSAENGKEAFDKMAAERYVAVLMDCQMPIMDGYTATRQRRQHEQAHNLPRLPIIAMTANAMVGDREKCLDAGMDDYLSKPLNRALLESTLRQWMEASPHALPESSPTPVPALIAAPPTTPATPAAGATVLSSEPAIDTAILAELREVMGQEFVSLVHVFLDDAPRAIARIHDLARKQDIAAIAAPAHTLKSTSANLGALVLSAQARSMELDARQGSLRDAEAKAAGLMAEFGRVAAELRQRIS